MLLVRLGDRATAVHDSAVGVREVALDRGLPPVERFVPPEQFAAFERIALDLGFRNVASGPMVRSSYHADRQAAGV